MDIVLQDISKYYTLPSGEAVTILDQVNLRIKKGDFVTVVGPSGSGKTTLLSIMGLLTSPSEGKVLYGGWQLYPGSGDRSLSQLRGSKLGFVFQFPSLHPTLTVLENVLLPLAFGPGAGEQDAERARELLSKVGLAHKSLAYPYQLSGGEQRRVAMARGLIRDPEVIMADEPTGALDEKSARVILELLQELNQRGKTIIMVTHDLTLVDGSHRVLQVDGAAVRELG